MRLRSRQRHLVIWSSSARRAARHTVSPYVPSAPAWRIRRVVRIGALVVVIVVRPRWKPLLAGVALTVFGIIDRNGIGSMAMLPGFMMLWAAAMIPGDSAADHHRRQQLKRELAEYSTAAQRRDLEAVLDRYPDGVTGEIREILAMQGTEAQKALPSTGRY